MKPHRSRDQARRGVTLLLTLLVLVLAVTLLSRQMLRTTVDRLQTAAAPFTVESQWVADGVARQWLKRSQGSPDLDELLKPVHWSFEGTLLSPRMEIDVCPSSAQNKLYLPTADSPSWTGYWRSIPGTMELSDIADQRLLETGNTALEVILAPQYISAQAAYIAGSNQPMPPGNLFTVWADGKVDLNRAPLEILRLRLKTFTDAQLSGILRLRSQGPILRIEPLTEELSLTDDQQQLLTDAATLRPTCIELVIRIKKGGLNAMYHAVITVGGKVLEVRPILWDLHMKTFASTASQFRAYAVALRAGGFAGIILAGVWMGYAAFRPVPKYGAVAPPASRKWVVADTTQRGTWLSALEARPLRKPLPVVAVAASAPVKAIRPPDLEIVATMVNPGQTPRAYVRSKNGKSAGKLVSVEPGKLIDGATVKEISDGQVTLEIGDQEFVIKVARKPS